VGIYTGEASEEPWAFPTTNVRIMIQEAFDVAIKAMSSSEGVTEVEVLIAVNNLRHAAAELERSLLEKKYGAT
jgi:hypothetical protein